LGAASIHPLPRRPVASLARRPALSSAVEYAKRRCTATPLAGALCARATIVS
jgi:hypothetical protein